MYNVGYSYSSFGAATPDWFTELAEKNPNIKALVPWDSANTYGKLFSEGWQLKPNRRYITPYPTFELMVRAVDGIRKYNEQSRTWAEQIPSKFGPYREAGLIFVDTVLDEAYKKCQDLLKAVLYNSEAKYGLKKELAVPWQARYAFYVYMGLIGWTNPASWAGLAAISLLKKAPDYVTTLGWTVHTIIKIYNISKKYKEAFESTVRMERLHPDLANLPALAEAGMLTMLEEAAGDLDSDPEAADTLRELGLLPAEPDDPTVLPTLPNPKEEAEKPSPAWYWWAGALGVGLLGAGGVALAVHLGKKKGAS